MIKKLYDSLKEVDRKIKITLNGLTIDGEVKEVRISENGMELLASIYLDLTDDVLNSSVVYSSRGI